MKKKSILALSLFAISCNAFAQWNNLGNPGIHPTKVYSASIAADSALGLKTTVKTFDGTNWVNVGSAGFSAGSVEGTAIGILNGTPYVSFADYGNSGKTNVYRYAGNAWTTVPANSTGFSDGAATNTDIAFDGTTPYVAYRDVPNSNGVTVKKFDGTNWVTVGTPGFSGIFSEGINLEMDGSTPYVFYREQNTTFDGYVKKFDGTNWVNVGTNPVTPNYAGWFSMVIISGTPYIAYADVNGPAVMKFDGTNWVTVGNSGFSGGGSYAKLSAENGNLYITCVEASFRATCFMFNGTVWVQVGAPQFSPGTASDIATAAGGGKLFTFFNDYTVGERPSVMKYDIPTAIAATDKKQPALQVFPNPATDQLTVITASGENGTVEIYDITGTMAQAAGNFFRSQSTVDVSALSAGVYFVRVKSVSGTAVVKFVKN